MKKEWGVYIIQSISHPSRVYVGSSTSLTERLYRHRYQLKRGCHHSILLNRHVAKYGIDDVVFEVLEKGEYVDINHLLAREQGWYTRFCFNGAVKPYFNIAEFAGMPSLGRKDSIETREKKRIAMLGKNRGKRTAEHIQHWRDSRIKNGTSNGLTGKPKPQSVRNKISQTLSGRKLPPRSLEHSANLSKSLTGIVRSEESKQRQSQTRKERKIAPWNKGKRGYHIRKRECKK